MSGRSRPGSSAVAYALAVLVTAGVLLIRLELAGVLGDLATFIPFVLPVMIASWYGGLNPGLLATVLSALGCVYLFVEPIHSLRIVDPREAVGIFIFLLVGGAISVLSEQLHAARRRLEAEQETRRASEEKERRRADQMAALMEAVPAAVWTAEDPYCRRISGNAAAYAMLRSPEGELPAHFTFMKDGKEIADRDLPMQTAAASGTDVRDAELSLQFADGSIRHILGNATPLRNGNGSVRSVIGVFVDITDRKRSEKSLRRTLGFQDAVMRSMGEGLYTVDTQGLVTYVNPAAERLLGWTSAELLGRKMHDVTHHSHPDGSPFPAEECEGLRVLRDGTPLVDFEDFFIRKDGTCFPVVYSASRLVTDDEVAGIVVAFRDTTQMKRAEEALRLANRQKDDFLATLAHELRNPLAPIRHAIHILKLKGPPLPELRWARGVIDRQVQQMSRLIDDLLDVSRITRNRLPLRKETVDLGVVLRNAVETSRPFIEEHGHTLTLALGESPVYVGADVIRLAQVFSNLLNNAAKFTDPGGTIGLTLSQSDGEVAVSIRDSGIGIPSHMLAQVFEPFVQVDRGLERTRGGLGLGLTLSARLAEMHGGRIEPRSDGQGKGSEFVVTLPVLKQGGVSRIRPEPSVETVLPQLRRRILIADDNVDAATCLSALLEITGCECRVVHDGLSALRAATEFRPEIAVLDIGMPGLNGYEVAAQIRERMGGDVALVALTGWGQKEDKRHAIEVGFDLHLVKPVEPARLMELLRSLVRPGAEGPGCSVSTRTARE